mgnify:CR=1 FL=1
MGRFSPKTTPDDPELAEWCRQREHEETARLGRREGSCKVLTAVMPFVGNTERDAFGFALTSAQERVTREIFADMAQARPMRARS